MMGIDETMPELGQMAGPELPDWVREGPIYEIFVRNFSNEGNFKAVENKIPYLKDLGIKTIWLMPIHPISKKDRKGTVGSPYAIADFMEIEPSLGSKTDFNDLVTAIHQADMRIIIDLVINQSGNDHLWHHTHPEYYLYPGKSDRIRKVPEWTDITDLNYENSDLRNELAAMVRYWVEEFDIDGYRCDVAGLVPLDFWQAVIADLSRIKDDLFMLAEWQSSSLHKNEFNAYYDWVLYYLLTDISMGKRNVNDIKIWYQRRNELFPKHSLAMQFTENHDLPRTISKFKGKSYKPFVTLGFLLPGLPLIYAGQEKGAAILPSLFDKLTVDWNKTNDEVSDFYRRLFQLYREYHCLRDGQIEFLDGDNSSVLAMKIADTQKTLYALLNFCGNAVTLQCPELCESYGTDLLKGEVFDGAGINLKPWQVQILDIVDDDVLVV
jgi:glycosidase